MGRVRSDVRSALRRNLALEMAWSQQWLMDPLDPLDHLMSSLDQMVQGEQVVPNDISVIN